MIVKSEKTLNRYRAAGLCDWCYGYHGRRDPHHVLTRGHGGGSRLDIDANLVSLCRACHNKHGDDPDRLGDFLDMVAKREKFASGEALQEWLWMVLRLPKNSKLPAAPVVPF